MVVLVRNFACRVLSLGLVIASLLLVGSVGSPLLSTPPAKAQTVQNACFNYGKAEVAYHAETGKVRFVGTEPGQRIARPLPLAASASAEAAARAYLAACGTNFGIRSEAAELALMHEKALDDGRAQVRFQQVYQGVPVLGGELITMLDGARNIVSVNGEILPDLDLSTTPRIGADTARQTALAVAAKTYKLDPAALTAAEPTLWIHNRAIMGGRGMPFTSLVWRTEVVAPERAEIKEFVLVDAQRGAVTLHFNQVDTAKNRRIYDKNNVPGTSLPGTLVRTEGGPATGIPDADNAYLYSGHAYDYFFNNFGRDSIDGAGMTMIHTVRYCPLPPGSCPYPNAFWNGQQMVYGATYASADDVVGHEMTHGVTEREANLFYYYQSGAINEALSDIFGELMDLGNGAGNDGAGVRWLMGEDLPIGAIRNMSDPPAFGDPDRMGSFNYTCDLGETDNGGVHSNSGVFNKAVFLMVDGGSFNGQTVAAIGATKTAKIVYEAQTNLLTSAADYQDLFNALQLACSNLTGVGGITSGDCGQVRKAALATQMDQQAPGCMAPEAPVCGPGLQPLARFRDDFENLATGNWTSSATSGANRWYYPQNSHPYGGYDATYATSGRYNVWGDDAAGTADYNFRMTANTFLPPASQPYLFFRHAYGFEDDALAYDGGVLEYSTDGGGSWNDTAGMFTHNGYDGTIYDGSGNPLANRSAFVGESNGYVSTRVNLAALAGQNVRFRFRLGTDVEVGDYGWFIDDVMIYTCTDKALFLPVLRR